ncbi:helix-turn-helix transcriptional regulator [Haloactinomyces albus]|uniref:DNA-binding NarL/FixJ family response regulator n=1 Tax=Haloactinomyces albus TaxID=1352928 RepID=A0AAE3ZI16_9ACTN|nr:LuxR C-terminal-related transcriptional regulator [Haloactinomyces albus]MDR7304276.1 DNA-binding NarL/FixJ family response regulator [Haloactinomyces albus]
MEQTRHPLMRPDDADAFRQALRSVQRRTEVPLVFGGQVLNGALRLSEFLGARTSGLRGLSVFPGAGLGGHVVAYGHPAAVNDYGTAKSITHDYDRPVLGEGIRSVVAAPVTVHGSVRGVLYGAVRAVLPLGDRAVDALVDASRRLAGEISLRDEVDRRVQLLQTAACDELMNDRDRVTAEEVRELHTEFRSIAQAMEDTELRDRLRQACERLARLGVQRKSELISPLAPRELDVLAQVALGCSNAEAGRRLSLLPETVKAYLRSAMRKLEVHSRHEAVVVARRRGLLP